MDPSNIPKGAGQLETDGQGKPLNKPGVYEHPQAGKRITVLPDAKSTAQADALVRTGFVRVADAPTRNELKDQQDKQRKADMELEKKGIQPGITADPNVPTINVTASPQVEDLTAQVSAEKARADAAEAQLAALKSENAAPAEPEAPAAPEAPSEPETPSEPEAPADEEAEESADETPAEESAEGASDSQTNEEEGK